MEQFPELEDRLTGLVAEGEQRDTGMDMDLLCCKEGDSKVRQGRAVTVLDLLSWVRVTLGLMGLPVTDIGRIIVPSPSLAVLIRHDENLVTGDVAAMLSVLERRSSPV